MGLIDLHTHTDFSDGTDSAKQLLEKANRAHIEVLSITDHDSVAAYQEILSEGYLQAFEGKLLAGVELFASFEHQLIDILAYGFDLGKMAEFIASTYDPEEVIRQQEEYFYKIKAKMLELGFRLDPALEFEPPYCTDAICREIWKYPENLCRLPKSVTDYPELFYRCLSDPKGELYTFNPSAPDSGKIIEAVHQAGGLAFLAHPYVYMLEDTEEFVLKMVTETGIDGLEVFHSLHSAGNIESLLHLAAQNQLLVSGGSDYHGRNKPHIKLAVGCGGLKVPEEYFNWTKELRGIK